MKSALQPEKFCTSAWHRSLAQAVDSLSTSQHRIPAKELMERAGKAVADYILQHIDAQRPLILLAGSGNNGGDALVAAKYLAQAKRRTYIHRSDDGLDQLEAILTTTISPVVVDGFIGIGLSGRLRDGPMRSALARLATLPHRTVIAIDLPSGMDIDNAAQIDIPLAADVTLTFGAVKPAMLISPARALCGEIIVVDIGFPEAAIIHAAANDPVVVTEVDAAAIVAHNPWHTLPADAHKFTRGHVLVIGGSAGKPGAPMLTGLAALRSGCGWSSIALAEATWQNPDPGWPLELTFESFFLDGKLSAAELQKFVEERRVKAVVIGPGTMESPLTDEIMLCLHRLQGKQNLFVVFDAGTTRGLGTVLQGQRFDPALTVMTPHPGEWQRLSMTPLDAPLSIEYIKASAKTLNSLGITAIYKNATPVVTPISTDLAAAVCTSGSNILARAGSGDVLAGIIAAHGAIDLPAATACMRGYSVLAAAAQLAAKDVGHDAVLASDILLHIGLVS